MGIVLLRDGLQSQAVAAAHRHQRSLEAAHHLRGGGPLQRVECGARAHQRLLRAGGEKVGVGWQLAGVCRQVQRATAEIPGLRWPGCLPHSRAAMRTWKRGGQLNSWGSVSRRCSTRRTHLEGLAWAHAIWPLSICSRRGRGRGGSGWPDCGHASRRATRRRQRTFASHPSHLPEQHSQRVNVGCRARRLPANQHLRRCVRHEVPPQIIAPCCGLGGRGVGELLERADNLQRGSGGGRPVDDGAECRQPRRHTWAHCAANPTANGLSVRRRRAAPYLGSERAVSGGGALAVAQQHAGARQLAVHDPVAVQGVQGRRDAQRSVHNALQVRRRRAGWGAWGTRVLQRAMADGALQRAAVAQLGHRPDLRGGGGRAGGRRRAAPPCACAARSQCSAAPSPAPATRACMRAALQQSMRPLCCRQATSSPHSGSPGALQGPLAQQPQAQGPKGCSIEQQ